MGLKARVKATGEIVEIYRFVDTEQNEWIDCYLDFLEPIATDYWTRLEHQAAIAAMQAYIVASHLSGFSFHEGSMGDCKSMAHALVEKYKKEEK